jgi:hypothetical protein
MITQLVSSNCSIYNLGLISRGPTKKDIQCHGHTKLYIEQFDDAKGVFIVRKSKKDRQCHGHTILYIEQFDDTNGVIIGALSVLL